MISRCESFTRARVTRCTVNPLGADEPGLADKTVFVTVTAPLVAEPGTVTVIRVSVTLVGCTPADDPTLTMSAAATTPWS